VKNMFRKVLSLLAPVLLFASVVATAQDIIQAAKKGDLEVIKSILAADPAAVGAVDERGFTALHYAAINAHWDACIFLMDQGADVNAISGYKSTPLHAAAQHDNPEIVKLMIDRGANPNIRNSWGMTSLHMAVWRNCPKTVECLLDHGVDPSIETNEGWTALHYAAICGRKGLYDLLLKRGLPADAKDNNGKTASELWQDRPQPVDIELSLQDYVGLYDDYLPVWINEGKLYLQDYAVEELYPIGEDSFYTTRVPWKVVFLRDPKGKVDKVEIHFIRRTVTLERTGELPVDRP
jgi:hypothetical protein